jgi:O-antigen ligase
MRVLLASLPIGVMLAALYLRDPGFSGRTTVWPEFVRLWGTDRILGVGQAGIDELIDAGVLPDWAHHAHNVALDTLVRYGVVGLAVMVVAFASAVFIVWKSARSGRVAGLALVVMLIVGGLADTILHWRYLTTPMAVLLLAVLMSTGLRVPVEAAGEAKRQDDDAAVGRIE